MTECCFFGMDIHLSMRILNCLVCHCVMKWIFLSKHDAMYNHIRSEFVALGFPFYRIKGIRFGKAFIKMYQMFQQTYLCLSFHVQYIFFFNTKKRLNLLLIRHFHEVSHLIFVFVIHSKIFTSVEYFLYKLYWKRRVCHDSMTSIAMQIRTAPPISFCLARMKL